MDFDCIGHCSDFGRGPRKIWTNPEATSIWVHPFRTINLHRRHSRNLTVRNKQHTCPRQNWAVLRECPQKLRDHLLVNSQQFESYYNKLRAIIQAYLNTNKTWIVNDFTETVLMDVDYMGKSKGKSKSKSKCEGKSKDRNQGKGKSKINSKKQRNPATTKNATCA